MTKNQRLKRLSAGLLIVLAAAGIGEVVSQRMAPRSITADFLTATAIYPGDEVRVLGVKVGVIDAIAPRGGYTTMTMHIDRDIPIPADAKAVIVAQNLIAARYVQLTPPYADRGPTLRDGAGIPLQRTAVPVEWDEVKDQLTRLATELGPSGGVSTTSVAHFIDSAAGALDGNGDKLRQTLAQISGVGRILADGGGNLVDVIANLQKFIAALRDSNEQIVQFEDRLASLTSVLDGSKSDLDAALTNVSDVVAAVQRFIKGSRNQTAEQVQRLTNVTQNVVDHQKDLEQILHVAPTAFANSYNIFDPRDGAAAGVFSFKNFSNPSYFFCGLIQALENVTATETGKLCRQTLGPALNKINFDDLPFPINPILTAAPRASDLIYSEPQLAPGAEKPADPPEPPPAFSAYTGAGDVPAPPGYGAPDGGLPSLMLPPSDGPLPAEAPGPAPAQPGPPSDQLAPPPEGTPPP
jgi:phospholipid/cholesterol/gamma-HCH transport system substrate-binding protein